MPMIMYINIYTISSLSTSNGSYLYLLRFQVIFTLFLILLSILFSHNMYINIIFILYINICICISI